MKNLHVISYNVNGIRAAFKKGFLDWLQTNPADIICLQEIKANQADIDIESITQLGYYSYWFSAQKKGYSGVAILSKYEATHVTMGNGFEQSDFEGRVIRADIEGITVINAYFPSGTSGDERQAYKYLWLNEFSQYTTDLLSKSKNIIICGDYNIAHKEIDIHDPKGNKKSSGFLPEERAWLDAFYDVNFHDSFRILHPYTAHQYSWWSQRFPSVRLNNKGWRIDYISVSEALKNSVIEAGIYPDIKHSDHCPIHTTIKI